MGSKAIVFLGLLVVMLLVSSEVAARELVEETSAKATEVEPDQGGRGGGRGGHCRHRCCGRYGCRCCSHPGEDVDADFNEAETHN